MPLPSFSTVLDRLNSSTLTVFSNRTIAWSGGSCSGLFQPGYVENFGMVNADNSVLVREADIASLAFSTAITIDGVAHTQRERHPDGSGMIRIVVEKS
jgi:hypothetical protein